MLGCAEAFFDGGAGEGGEALGEQGFRVVAEGAVGQRLQGLPECRAARRASLHALLEQERWLDVQLQVKIESEFLKRDLAEREERAIRQAAETRQQHRRLQENASALL
ncbi:hypothetical protein ACV34O_31760, partial [Pseudomonas aeruginosa]